jgi:CheY-like chemotaxis protein
MTDDLNDFPGSRAPLPGRPLAGLTVLVVEDSRYASEAMRLLCLRSGARIRRADCLRSARRHLQTYRPAVAIVDLGLPDGSGCEFIADIARLRPRVPAVLAASGDTTLAGAALAAGADGFLAKPVESLAAFQTAVLKALPRAWSAGAGRPDRDAEPLEPDPLALREDLAHADELLGAAGATDDGARAYLAQFLSGLALSAHDRPLADAAQDFARDHRLGLPRLADLVRSRLASGPGF